jgi:hypothetical protein
LGRQAKGHIDTSGLFLFFECACYSLEFGFFSFLFSFVEGFLFFFTKKKSAFYTSRSTCSLIHQSTPFWILSLHGKSASHRITQTPSPAIVGKRNALNVCTSLPGATKCLSRRPPWPHTRSTLQPPPHYCQPHLVTEMLKAGMVPVVDIE